MSNRLLSRSLAVAALAAGLGFSARAAIPAREPEPAREQAYRANNVGVALLEQYRFADAVESLRKAVALDPAFGQAQVNLAIALYYVPEIKAALAQAEKAAALLPQSPQPAYLLGLIARQENRPEDAERNFRAVREKDPRDVGASVNLGQVLVQQRRYDEAIPLLEGAVAAEPYNVTATYNLGVALTRAGRREEGAAVTKRFQELRESLYKTQFGQNYLEQGRYAEALPSTGAEPELVEAGDPGVTLAVDDTALPDAMRTLRSAGPPTLVDVDGDGQLDLLVPSPQGVRLLRNQGGRFADATTGAGLGEVRAGSAVAADLDGDAKADVLLLAPLRLLKNEGGRLREAGTGLPADASTVAAALADLDHDGDLDVVLGAAPGLRLLRNAGDMSFTDVTSESKLDGAAGAAALVATDFDNRRDLDLAVSRASGAPLLFRNRRDGTFADVAGEVGLKGAGPVLAVSDVNKDGFSDFFLGGPKEARLLLSDGRGSFAAAEAPAGAAGAESALLLDVDADGLVDLVTGGPAGVRAFRNLGRGFTELGRGLSLAVRRLAAADLDQDGDLDLVAQAVDGGLRLVRNEGGNRNHALRVALTGRVSNKTGLGSKVELRAGSLRQKLETYASTPAVAADEVFFGLGRREKADVVRVIWTSGIVQTETELEPSPTRARLAALPVTELDRKPSSCPYLFAWNGRSFGFVTDFLGAGEMGYWLAPRLRNTSDPDEYVRLTGDQLVARDGRYELRVTNELEETLFLDHVRLLAVDHPADVELHPAEGMTKVPRTYRLFAARDLRTPRVSDEAGRDWTSAAAVLDRRAPEGFELLPLRGYAKPHAHVLDLADVPPSHTLLLLTAWTDYAFSSDNVAAAQRGWALAPPVLEAEDAEGEWRTAIADVGIPVGRPQTIVLDLAGVRRGPSRRLRLRTNMRIYWDRIAVGAPAEGPFEPRRLEARRADLGERGFSAESSVDGRPPYSYDYASTSRPSPWKLLPGTYTRTGDVRELLGASDDLFVVSRPGDEVALSFDARRLPALAPGLSRTFLLYGVGFSKEMDINSSSPDVAGPLPFHGMRSYPYPPEEAPERLRRNAARQAGYNTRVVPRTMPPLELAQR